MQNMTLEQMGADIHRPMRNTDDVNVIVVDDIENDVTSLGKTSVARMYVVSLATRERIVSQPLKPTV